MIELIVLTAGRNAHGKYRGANGIGVNSPNMRKFGVT